MKRTQNANKSRLLIISGLVLIAVTSCTKEIPFKTADPNIKQNVVSKDLLDLEGEYLHSSHQQSSSMSSPDAFPFFNGDNKRVKLQVLEKSIRVMETERDLRYADNDNNNKPVLEIPIEHVQFECVKDTYGECTNTEADSTTLLWKAKNSVRFSFELAKSGQLDFLPIHDSATFGDNCHELLSSEVVYSKIEKDAINFQVKRTFKTKLECLSELNSLGDATISAVYHYSFVKIDSILSKDYETISYPESSKDEGTFGFFSTSRIKLDVDHTNTQNSKIQIMNRWNPNRSEITYYLSDEFAKPRNKKINDLTVQTVDSLNAGLRKAGVKFQINLKQPEGKIPGDIRNSMIVLVEDPTAASVIGYGPQTEDPVTGEIVSARTIMFLGTIENGVKQTYDDIVRIKKEARLALASKEIAEKSLAPKLILEPSFAQAVNNKLASGRTFGINLAIQKQATDKIEKTQAPPVVEAGTDLKPHTKINVAKIEKEFRNYKKQHNEDYSAKDLKTKIKYLQEVKNCAMPASAGGLSKSISPKLLAAFKDDAKPWNELSEDEKAYAMDVILPETWVPTLIHELGHNLGLRHNFQGSEDKANFFTNEELVDLGIDHEIPFTSVMEYGDDLKALTVLGKYDIAALRFAYNREVDVVDKAGKITTLKIPKTLEDLKLPADTTLKDYGFCTDEHAGINAGCKRFDMGTSYTEITQNIIQMYENWYAIRNFRNGRADFSLWTDYLYARRINGTFMDLRIMMEVRERIKYTYNIPEGHPVWTTNEFLKDLNQAALLAGQHMAKVLSVPDVSCAVSMKAKPNEVVAVLNLTDIDPDSLSCFNANFENGGFSQYKDLLVVVAQTGKKFNSMKDPSNRNPYVDQIDVRGYWIDKVIATKVLFNRTTPISTFEKNNDNFLDMSELGQPLIESVAAIMQDNVVDTLDFVLRDGTIVPLKVGYDLSNTQVIEKHMFAPVAKYIGINTGGPTRLQQILSTAIVRNAVDPTGENEQDLPLEKAFSVFRLSEISDIRNIPGSLSIEIAADKYLATPNNVLAHSMMENLGVASTIEAVDPKRVEEIMVAREKGETKPVPVDPANPTDVEIAEGKIWDMETDLVAAFLDGVIKSSKFYTDMVQVLPSAR